MPVRQVAKLLGVSVSAANNWMRQWRKDRKIGPSPIRGHRPPLLEKHTDWLLKAVKEDGELTLEEIRSMLRTRGVNVSVWTVWDFYRRHNVRLKRTRRGIHTQTKNTRRRRAQAAPHNHT